MKDITPDRVFTVVQEKLQDNSTHASVQTKDT
jgi:hypothetical protein